MQHENDVIVLLLTLPMKYVGGKLLQAVSMCPSTVQHVKLTLRNARNTRFVHVVPACLEPNQKCNFAASLMFDCD